MENNFNENIFDDSDEYLNDEVLNERRNKILSFIKSGEYIPMKPADICSLLAVPSSEKPDFDGIVAELIADGKIVLTKKGKLMSAAAVNMYSGTFISNARGFGFVNTEELEDDIFIPPDMAGGAMHRDRVLCRITRSAEDGKRREGEIIKILERGKKDIVGTFESVKGFGFVTPDDKKFIQDIFVSKEHSMGAVSGHKVVVKITAYPDIRRNPEGEITEILGHKNDPGVDILSIIREFELPLEFSEEVYRQIESLPEEISAEDLNGREDLRKMLTVTIDGEDAKDLDDAVTLEILGNGNYSLGVHIADVSHYVRENSFLDKEAYARGTSVYLVDRVIPMLPHRLSNGICSLNPNEDRLTLSCIMEIDHRGSVVSHRIVKSVIHSNQRLTYTAVNRIIEEGAAFDAEYSKVTPMLLEMDKLRKILGEKRRKRGAINFDFPEAKVILDENGKIKDILPREHNAATNLIEEFMLVCNETVAEDYFWQDSPFLYRNHEVPDDEKIQKMSDFIKSFGYKIKGFGEVHPKDIQHILSAAEGSPEEAIISRVVLRSMKQARYMSEPLGHFGLAAKYYCHFTSPIRRYPDLEIHRIIKERINGMTDKRASSLKKNLPEIAKQCSLRERIAEDAERETVQVKMVEYMSEHIGEAFEGVISGVMSWGVYVELPNTIEGMVSAANIEDDYYIYDEQSMSLTGKRHGKVYGIGNKVRVMAVRADKELRTIDFVFADDEDED